MKIECASREPVHDVGKPSKVMLGGIILSILCTPNFNTTASSLRILFFATGQNIAFTSRNQVMAPFQSGPKNPAYKGKARRKANGHLKSMETSEQLYASALTLVEQSQPDEALKKAQKLLTQVQRQPAPEVLPALNLLGEICIETGDAESAKDYFERAVQLDPDGEMPEAVGGGAEKFLWLAQLCEEGGLESVQWFEKGAKALHREIAALEGGVAAGLDDESLLMMRTEKKRKLANALCGIVEIYMTDLSWEEDAEARCDALITEAMSLENETSAEVLQTLASVRLSQQRNGDAQAALTRSIETWKDLDPEDPDVPDFATRVSLSRLLMEAELESQALNVLNRLVLEDDQSVEAWYLGGWCQNLMADREKAASSVESNGTAKPDATIDLDLTLKGSRHWLKTSMKLYDLLDYEDDRLFKHAKELVAGLDGILGPEDEQAEGRDEWDDEWEGIQDGHEELDEEMKDA